MTLKTIADLTIDMADGQQRGINAEKMRNLIEGMTAVAGMMYTVADQVQAITPSFKPLTIWTNSKDLKGLQEDFVGGVYNVKPAGEGQYIVAAVLSLSLNTPSNIEIAVAKDGSAGSYRTKKLIGTDQDQIIIVARRLYEADTTLGLEIKGSVSATATFYRSQLLAFRY